MRREMFSGPFDQKLEQPSYANFPPRMGVRLWPLIRGTSTMVICYPRGWIHELGFYLALCLQQQGQRQSQGQSESMA